MKLENTWPGRPQYYDRNAIPVVVNINRTFVDVVGPTYDLAYTVPAARAAFLCFVQLWSTPQVAGAGTPYERIRSVVGSGVVGDAWVLDGSFVATAITQVFSVFTTSGMIMTAGQKLGMVTQGFAAGWTILAMMNVSLVEFDA